MKKVITHKPLRRSKPLDLPPLDDPFEQGCLIQFRTRHGGGYAIERDGCPGEFFIDELG